MVIALVGGTLSILVTDLALILVLMGIGLLGRRAFGLRSLDVNNCFAAFWMGFSGVILFMMLWNFAFPISGVALPLVVAAGGAGWLVWRHDLRLVFRRAGWRPTVWFLVVLLLAGVWVADMSMGPLSNWDSALYHVQGVKWAKTYPVVPGLANLYGPLAFNNSSFLYNALLDAEPWAGRGNHLASGTLLLAMLMQVLVGVPQFVGIPGHAGPRHLFDFLFLAPVVTLISDDTISSYVTDLPATLVILAAMSQLYSLVSAEKLNSLEGGYRVVCVTTLLVVAVCIKISIAVFAAICWLLVVLLWMRQAGQSGSIRTKTIGWATGISSLLGLSWVARGIVLSGYPVFPVPVAGFPVDWRAPLEHAQAEFALIIQSGRAAAFKFGMVTGLEDFWGWFPRWTRHLVGNPFEVVVPLGIAAVAGVLYIVGRQRAVGLPRPAVGRGWWILLPASAGIAAWFMGAPEPRYVMSLFWTLAALCTTQAFGLLRAGDSRRAVRGTCLACLFLGVSPAFVNPLLVATSDPLTAIVKYNLTRPGTDLWFHPIGGRAELKTFITGTGLVLNVPVGNGGRCWDAPLPCTPNPAPNLRLRTNGKLERGFAVDGSWQMMDWPWDWLPRFLPAWREIRRTQ